MSVMLANVSTAKYQENGCVTNNSSTAKDEIKYFDWFMHCDIICETINISIA